MLTAKYLCNILKCKNLNLVESDDWNVTLEMSPIYIPVLKLNIPFNVPHWDFQVHIISWANLHSFMVSYMVSKILPENYHQFYPWLTITCENSRISPEVDHIIDALYTLIIPVCPKSGISDSYTRVIPNNLYDKYRC